MKRRSLILLSALFFSTAPVVAGQSPVAAAGTCRFDDDTNCKVGDIGPRGGIVYYDAGSMQWWGRFLEIVLFKNREGGNARNIRIDLTEFANQSTGCLPSHPTPIDMY